VRNHAHLIAIVHTDAGRYTTQMAQCTHFLSRAIGPSEVEKSSECVQQLVDIVGVKDVADMDKTVDAILADMPQRFPENMSAKTIVDEIMNEAETWLLD
jgi:hypothetical protein